MTTPTDVTFNASAAPAISANWLNGANDWINGWYNGGSGVLGANSGTSYTAATLRSSLGYATGNTVITNTVPGTLYTGTISHGLGTDDIDFGFSYLSSVAGNEFLAGIVGRTYSRGCIIQPAEAAVGYDIDTLMPALPSSGNINFGVRSASSPGSTITIYWWARKRS